MKNSAVFSNCVLFLVQPFVFILELTIAFLMKLYSSLPFSFNFFQVFFCLQNSSYRVVSFSDWGEKWDVVFGSHFLSAARISFARLLPAWSLSVQSLSPCSRSWSPASSCLTVSGQQAPETLRCFPGYRIVSVAPRCALSWSVLLFCCSVVFGILRKGWGSL